MVSQPVVYIGAPDHSVIGGLSGSLAESLHVVPADKSTATSHIAAALLALRLSSPPALVLDAATASHAATLGSALRAARTPARSYVLINPASVPQTRVGDYDWPDAPITVLLTGESPVAAAAQLRGWDVVTCRSDKMTSVLTELLT